VKTLFPDWFQEACKALQVLLHFYFRRVKLRSSEIMKDVLTYMGNWFRKLRDCKWLVMKSSERQISEQRTESKRTISSRDKHLLAPTSQPCRWLPCYPSVTTPPKQLNYCPSQRIPYQARSHLGLKSMVLHETRCDPAWPFAWNKFCGVR